MRLIDADALIQNHCGACANKEFCAKEYCPHYEIRRRIEAAPTIEAEPVRNGRWIEATKHRDENGTILTDYECSECCAMVKDSDAEEIGSERFCYNCGADMREGGADI